MSVEAVASATRRRVLVVDDSALMRQVLSEILSTAPDLEVIGCARDGVRAWTLIQETNPDVITLDVEMPRLDGLGLLRRIMAECPRPVVMVSALTERSCATTLSALELGAFDFVTKPRLDIRRGTLEQADELVAKVRAAAQSQPRRRQPEEAGHRRTPPDATTHPGDGGSRRARTGPRPQCVVIGASTGGPEALATIVPRLPADSPALVLTQHMPALFTRSFAERLDRLSALDVKEAEDGDELRRGLLLVAPGGLQTRIVPGGRVSVRADAPVNGHSPSVDVLFHSCAAVFGSQARGVLMTGMGADGARGLHAMRLAGASTIAQDLDSCVVFGMPREAIALGAVERVLGLLEIPGSILEPLR